MINMQENLYKHFVMPPSSRRFLPFLSIIIRNLLFHSGSTSCLGVWMWMSEHLPHHSSSHLSVLLEVRDSFEREWRFCCLHRISAARRLTKSIAANEELTEWKPQFTLNNVQEGFLCFVNDMMEKYCWYSKSLWGLLLFMLILGAAGGGGTLREIKEYWFHISFLVFLPLYSFQICSRYPL